MAYDTADLSNFYLMTPLKRPEYGRVKLTDIPDEIIKEYKLCGILQGYLGYVRLTSIGLKQPR